MHLAPGTRLGRYEIRALLGVGGMGEVYLADDPTLRRTVAIKLLPSIAVITASPAECGRPVQHRAPPDRTARSAR